MSLNVSALSTWTDEHKLDLIAKSVLKGRTIDLINLQPGIKHSATINTLSSSPVFQAGACGWNASGTTVLDQRTITVCDIKLNESICLNTLEDYYTSKMMKAGSYNEEIPFEQLFADEKAAQVSSMVDSVVWQGDTAGSGNNALCDGFLKTMSADSSTVKVTGLTLTAGNIVDEVDSMVAAIPADIIDADDNVIFMGYDAYRVYAKALRDANLFHYDGAEDQGQEFTQMVPGTNVRVIAVKGLNGRTNLVASSLSNLYAGTDLKDEMEKFAIFYSADNDEVRVNIKFKIGVNYAFSEFVVYGN
jgi:hypothetical protein